ncbi:hypothetical protein [Aquimarina sp. RZ0]|uniref:hypothetical protein n=1 Tax=Aquimarina sp. RZ0 TaxID=2607730 RepID=UPI0011F20050|nr:hypothetical protein [Aquimarina sp. RZ0]KAA1244650.1 hypothetical protein F0000_15500 [Aquimarina sp. RZ0]
MNFLIVVFGLFFTIIHGIDVDEVRDAYRYANSSKEKTEQFYQLTQKTNHTKDNVMAAYYGCALTLKASISSKMGDKISYFKKGKKIIETAVQADPDNIEIRMIRLSVQMNAPRITGYRDDIEEDKNFMLKNINEVSSSKLKEFIKGFMSHSKIFSEKR